MKTQEAIETLRAYESRNVLFAEPDGSWPIVWERAKGVNVWDADGKKYLDLTAAFGVAAAGHANPNVVKAGQKQMAKLLHAMGDVHPHALKAGLARELSRITFGRWSQKTGKTIFCNSGFEAVEAALKTAMLGTGKQGVVAFAGGYHGLGYGALNVTHRDFFRRGFHYQLREFGQFAAFPAKASDLSAVELARSAGFFAANALAPSSSSRCRRAAASTLPPPGFLPLLRKLCDEHNALLIFDEIYTGFGRTGKWFGGEHSQTVPDLICLGKALTGGFPLSACVGRADIMDAAWPASRGEAMHTSTFLGHPVGCAMALAQIAEIEKLDLPGRSAELGIFLLDELQSKISNLKFQIAVRGIGLMAGVELVLPDGKPATEASLNAIKTLLQRGYIFLPEGEHGNVISLTPPLTITKAQLAKTVKALAEVLATN